MKMHDTLLMVCKVSVGSSNAKDSLELAPLLRFEPDETSSYLYSLWKKGLVKRFQDKRHRNAAGRLQRTYAYYIERKDVDRAIRKHLERPASQPKGPRPLSAAALMRAWPG